MTELIRIFNDGVEQLTKSPVWLVISLTALALGLLCKTSQFVPNKVIPLVVVLFSTLTYSFLGDPSKIENPYPRVMLAFYGFLLGFVVWGAHRFLLRRLEKFLPKDFFPPGSFDTDQFAKPKELEPSKYEFCDPKKDEPKDK